MHSGTFAQLIRELTNPTTQCLEHTNAVNYSASARHFDYSPAILRLTRTARVSFLQNSNHRESCQHFPAVRRLLYSNGQVSASAVESLVSSIFPEEAVCHVVHFSFVCQLNWFPVLTVVFCKVFHGEDSHDSRFPQFVAACILS